MGIGRIESYFSVINSLIVSEAYFMIRISISGKLTVVTVKFLDKVDLSCTATAVISAHSIYECLNIHHSLIPPGFERVKEPSFFDNIKESVKNKLTNMIYFIPHSFTLMASHICGFNSEVVEAIIGESEGKITPFSYIIWKLELDLKEILRLISRDLLFRCDFEFPENYKLEPW